MPLPTPNTDETRDDFISRCMGNDAMQSEYPEQDQRSAVCNRQWEDAQAEEAKSDGEVETKTFEPESVEIKDEEKGIIEAIIATLNVVDRDKEVILPGAIKSGSKVKMSSYAHDIVGGLFGGGAQPVGKGVIVVEGDKAIFRGKCFMNTTRGRDTFEVLKEMGKDQEWSFGFRVIGSEVPDEKWKKQGAELILTKIECLEASPVLVGAGIGTQTVSAKAAKRAELAAKKAQDEAAAAQAAAQKAADDALAVKEAEEAAARAEAERVEAEKQAATAEVARVEAETKAKAEEIARKERVKVDREEYERVQRSLRRMGLR